jgi:hypothetical protein
MLPFGGSPPVLPETPVCLMNLVFSPVRVERHGGDRIAVIGRCYERFENGLHWCSDILFDRKPLYRAA